MFLIIIPTYKEESTIGVLLQKLENFRINNKTILFDALVVDDNSPDETVKNIIKFEFPWVKLSKRNSKTGLGSAYKYGFKIAHEAGYSFVIQMDADGSHRVEDLEQLLNADFQFDLVVGSRWIPNGSVAGWSIHRKIISILGNKYANFMLGMRIKDSTSGFRRVRVSPELITRLESFSAKGYGFQIEVAYHFSKQTKGVLEVPITFVERESGDSKMTLGIALEAFKRVTYLGFNRLLKILLS